MMKDDGQTCGHHGRYRQGRRPSSFWMQDPEVVFGALALKPGDRFLDMGCGPGDYALEAAAAVGASGTVRALEKDPGRIEALNTEAQRRGFLHLRAMAADITEPLPVRDHCMDVCLIATVLHIPAVTEHMRSIFAEIRRVLKPEGRLAIIECKKEQTQFGPPMQMRLSPDDITHSIKNCGFEKLSIVDLGMNYMMLFGAKGFTSPSLTAGNRKDS